MYCLDCNWNRYQELWLERPYDGQLTETSSVIFFGGFSFKIETWPQNCLHGLGRTATSCT